jgi:L-fuconolactonase
VARADAHCHVSTVFYEPVETLLFQMARSGVEHAILIQMREQYNNDYQFACIARYPGQFASVVQVDHSSPDAPAELERLAARGASGVRLNAAARSPGANPLAIWRAAERLGLAVSCSASSATVASDEFSQLVRAVPRLPIVLEHLAGQLRLSGRGQSIERAAGAILDDQPLERVLALARYSNVYVKIPGLGEFCERAMPVTEPFPFVKPIPPLLERFYQAFGANRLMWGSDYPPVSIREGYANALQLPMLEFEGKSESERNLIFGETALRVFPVRG